MQPSAVQKLVKRFGSRPNNVTRGSLRIDCFHPPKYCLPLIEMRAIAIPAPITICQTPSVISKIQDNFRCSISKKQ